MKRISVLLVLSFLGTTFGQPYEHVTITSDSLTSAFVPLGNLIEDQMGMNDTAVAVEDIYDAYPGRDEPEKVRSFIRHAYENWGTTHVLLGGDDHVVPVRYAWARVWWAGVTMLVPTDWYYSCLDGDWDADGDDVFGEMGDSVDLLPDVHVGRAPVSTRESVSLFTGKLTGYCSDSTASYLGRILLAGFDIDATTFGETTMELYDSLFVPQAMKPASKVYDSHTGNHKDTVLSLLEQGQHLFVHDDHGNYYFMGCGSRNHGWSLRRHEMTGLANEDRLTIMMSLGCYTARFDSLDCILEHAFGAPNGGAVATVGHTRYSLYGRDRGQNPQRTLSALQIERLLGELFGHGGHGSLEDFTVAKASLASLADTSEPDRWCAYVLTLFGEPRMPVWVPEMTGVAERKEGGRMRAVSRLPTVMRGPGLARMDVRVTDIQGRDVTDRRSELAPGVYFLRQGETRARRKVIIQ